MDKVYSRIKELQQMLITFPISPKKIVEYAEQITKEFPKSVKAKENMCFALCYAGHMDYISYNKVSGQDIIKRGVALLDDLSERISTSKLLKAVANECYMDAGEILFGEKKYEDALKYLNMVTDELYPNALRMKGRVYLERLALLTESLGSFISKLEGIAENYRSLSDGKCADVYHTLMILGKLNDVSEEQIRKYTKSHDYYQEKMAFLHTLGYEDENLDDYVAKIKKTLQ